jgi:hypothetical protein
LRGRPAGIRGDVDPDVSGRVEPKLIVTTLVPLNEYPAELTMVAKLTPSGLPCTDRVCVRVPHPLGSLRITWSIAMLPPRSTCPHCGKALLALSQYVAWLPSVMLADT